jgi:hypothetical protein
MMEKTNKIYAVMRDGGLSMASGLNGNWEVVAVTHDDPTGLVDMINNYHFRRANDKMEDLNKRFLTYNTPDQWIKTNAFTVIEVDEDSPLVKVFIKIHGTENTIEVITQTLKDRDFHTGKETDVEALIVKFPFIKGVDIALDYNAIIDGNPHMRGKYDFYAQSEWGFSLQMN